MDIEILEMADRKCTFILRNSSPAKANALRRTMLTDIPKMAIDTVDFHLGPIDVDGKEFESITPLFDEIIAHRLGMVPVPTKIGDFEFNYMDECESCGGAGCPNCTYQYMINKHGPCTVLSGDMMPVVTKIPGVDVSQDDLKPCDPNIPIVELADGQAVFIYAHAVKGIARKHVKWQVANGVGYKYMPVITVGDNLKETEEVVKNCPKDVFEIDGDRLVVKNPMECILCNACSDIDKAIVVDSDPTTFVFKFETDGSLTAEDVLSQAKKILHEDALDLGSKIVELAN